MPPPAFSITRDCLTCGHSLVGLQQPVCPECGNPFAHELLAAHTFAASAPLLAAITDERRNLQHRLRVLAIWNWAIIAGILLLGALVAGMAGVRVLLVAAVPILLPGIGILLMLMYDRQHLRRQLDKLDLDLREAQLERRTLTIVKAVWAAAANFDTSKERRTLGYSAAVMCYFLRLERGGCLVLEDVHVQEHPARVRTSLPRTVELLSFPRSGRVVSLAFDGDLIPISEAQVKLDAVDGLAPGLWMLEDLFFEISLEPSATSIFDGPATRPR